MSKTYAQLAREIAALQASAQRQLAIESKGAVAKINEMIAKYQLTASDLKFASSAAVAPSSSKGAKAGKAKAAAGTRSRYSDGQGNVWGGRGPRPRWLRSALAAGSALESFLTGTASSPASAPSVPAPAVAPTPVVKVVAKKVAAKKVAARKVAVKSASAAAKAPASTAAVKTAMPIPAAEKPQPSALVKKAAAKPVAKTASAAKPASKKAPAKKAVGMKRAAGAKPAGKVAPKKVAAAKKIASKGKSTAAKLPPASTSGTSTPTTASS